MSDLRCETPENSLWTIHREFSGYLRVGDNHRRALLEVECACGSREVRRRDHVLSGRSKCCKSCSSKVTLQSHPNHGWLSHRGQYAGALSRTHFLHIKHSAERRGYEFRLTQAELWGMFLKQRKRCALTGWPITISRRIKNNAVDWDYVTASVDRVDSNLGYTVDNVQWVHKVINRFKNNYSETDFLKMCQAVVDNQGKGGTCSI